MTYSEGITVIEGPHNLTTNMLFELCVSSVISSDKDVLFIDGRNSFDPYAILRIAKYLGADQGDLLSRIHIARAFTEYQMNSLIEELYNVIEQEQWNPCILAISYLSSLFSDSDIRMFKSILEHLRSLTNSSCKITIVTSYGKTNCDKLLASKADRLISIKRLDDKTISKCNRLKHIRIIDDGNVYEYVPLPRGQMTLEAED